MNKKHIWLMMTLCLVPLVAVGAILLFKIPVSGLTWGLLVALCPLSHLAMMWLMPHAHADHAPSTPQTTATPTHDRAAH